MKHQTQQLIDQHEKALDLLIILGRHENDRERKRKWISKNQRKKTPLSNRIWKQLLERNKQIEEIKVKYVKQMTDGR